MTVFLLFIPLIIAACVILNNASSKIGMPVLLAFILLGILFGNSGLFPIRLDNYSFAENTCTVALIFIMFYGGFGTRWKSAKSVIWESGVLASVGVILTAGITGVACHYLLKWGWIESFLMGSVVSSTDAASVFSILRSHKLGLKNNTAPLLEVESGSNDPCSYMLTVIMLALLSGTASGGKVAWMLLAQIGFGAGIGVLLAQLAIYVMKHMSFSTSGFDSLMVLAFAIASYSIPTAIGGNGYLSAYIVGIALGNADFTGKKNLVGFFDGLTGLMQVIIFFISGLVARPLMMQKVLLPSLAIFFILTLIARPVCVHLILALFKKYPLRQRALVSFAGLRGASSIVFAIMATISSGAIQNDILNVTFTIVLLSISLQGFLLPKMAEWLDMIDKDADVMRTFNDFSDENDVKFSSILISQGSSWDGRMVRELRLPKSVLISNVIREDGTTIVPDGNTVIKAGDQVIMCAKAFKTSGKFKVIENRLGANSKWIGHKLREYPVHKSQVLLIRHKDGKDIIPHGETVLEEGDILFINQNK